MISDIKYRLKILKFICMEFVN
ncbi:MAG: hypothetical protein E6K83_03180 [Thaumarchaeota archaeon]|nr:MAG: hypothetical protein E6K83_03180 [Nitrososphaerota archaeon]